MLEAVAAALHAVKISSVAGGETALLIGAGTIGLLALQAARQAGCSRVILADVHATRLQLAATLGAHDTLNASGENMVRGILQLTKGRGIHGVREAVGREETVAAAIGCVRKGGVVTLIGKYCATSLDTASKSRDTTDPSARVLRGCWRIPRSHAPGCQRKDQSRSTHLRDCTIARLHAREPNLVTVILDPRGPSSITIPGPR